MTGSNIPQNISVDEIKYTLPNEKIAKFPLEQRDASKILIWRDGNITESAFKNLAQFIPDRAMMVFNNTKVIYARIIFQKTSGAKVEIFCLEPYTPADYEQSFAQTKSCTWRCLVGNAKRWKNGELSINFAEGKVLTAERITDDNGTSVINFKWNDNNLTFADVIEKCGELPIPPYLNRRAEERDRTTYQTVYSTVNGSVAAPTAGLHFTKEIFHELMRVATIEEVTLHVGAGTFKPVKSNTLAGHEMHSEWFAVNRETIENILKHKGKTVAVGTTSVRTLESLYYIGLYLKENPNAAPEGLSVGQWTPYSAPEIPPDDAIQTIIEYLYRNNLQKLVAKTGIMIAPGYKFRIVDAIITNFHQPESTLLLLVSAFTGGRWRNIYDYALSNGFRFLSYGDSSLLIR
ncbi:MAG: S-adenosylmethionine:tRNA ribosyltransferase-isomerase [Dysgonamonadaceae bacterium]|jgi:S-adenosylmethionine:tRNA ribosyltransferase-isomerase|nr:S-adenosylmethionine:tRNA ribosyltransferase-isomerase [Dysgonamonadaceae bacterium]